MVSSHARFEIYILVKHLSFKISRLAAPALMDIIETSRSFSYDKDLRLFEIIKFLKFLDHEETSENSRNSIFLPVPVWNILYFFCCWQAPIEPCQHINNIKYLYLSERERSQWFHIGWLKKVSSQLFQGTFKPSLSLHRPPSSPYNSIGKLWDCLTLGENSTISKIGFLLDKNNKGKV